MSRSVEEFLEHALTLNSPQVKKMEKADPDNDGDNDVADLVTQVLGNKINPAFVSIGSKFAAKLFGA